MASRPNQGRPASIAKSIPVTTVTGTVPTSEERVRRRAYLLYEKRQRAGVPGDAVSDGLCAERELNAALCQPRQAPLT